MQRSGSEPYGRLCDPQAPTSDDDGSIIQSVDLHEGRHGLGYHGTGRCTLRACSSMERGQDRKRSASSGQ